MIRICAPQCGVMEGLKRLRATAKSSNEFFMTFSRLRMKMYILIKYITIVRADGVCRDNPSLVIKQHVDPRAFSHHDVCDTLYKSHSVWIFCIRSLYVLQMVRHRARTRRRLTERVTRCIKPPKGVNSVDDERSAKKSVRLSVDGRKRAVRLFSLR